MKYLITFSEEAPTEDRTDLNTYHKVVSEELEVAPAIENFFLNFGCLVSITVVPIFR